MRTLRKKRVATPVAYLERVNLAIDYVVEHLNEPMRLTDVARVAMFSPFHFHRVFQALMGETLADFAKRLRLDRALHQMAHTPRTSLTQVAISCGFSSSSDFSRSFKQRFGVPPSVFDIKTWRAANREKLEALMHADAARLHLPRLPARTNPDAFRVIIRAMPPRTVAYIRVANPYAGTAVFDAVHQLLAWADRNGLANGQWLGYQWENPEIVPLEQCRYHVAVEAERFQAKGAIGRFQFPAMTVAEVEIRGTIELELRALQWLYGVWLPRSGYVPDDHPCFEAWIGRPFAQGTSHFELHGHLPVKPA